MKNITLFLLTIVLLLVTACSSRVPFAPKEPLKDTSLVYLYVSSDESSGEEMSDPYYSIRINNKLVEDKIRSGEYIAFNLKPNITSISIIRGAIEEKTVQLELKSSQTYYLKARVNLYNDAFDLVEVNKTIGSKEIVKTGLAGSTAVEEDNILTELISSDKDKKEESSQTFSKTDEIKKAFKMKEEGIITEQEYKTLKAEILNAHQ